MRLLILSDTHGLFRPEILPHLAAADHILHAGDVGSDAILYTLSSYAPLTAIRGNIDGGGAGKSRCAQLPPTEAVELGGRLFYLVHSLADLDLNPVSAGVAAVVTGHSHKPHTEVREGVLYLNPGSCGPRRFRLPVTLAILDTETMRPVFMPLL